MAVTILPLNLKASFSSLEDSESYWQPLSLNPV
jgi:hypothetical protein